MDINLEDRLVKAGITTKTIELLEKEGVFTGWRDIALLVRDKEYKENEEHLIDILDVRCKDWGFLLRELFGNQLGTGDYAHMTVEHISMLMRSFRSLRDYSNQGFEAAHNLQRRLYSRATSHDRHGHTSSICQMFKHFYAEKLLFLRLCFTMARECAVGEGNQFYFKGCGWPAKHTVNWTPADITWIHAMTKLQTAIFGDDFLSYETIKKTKVVQVAPECLPVYQYDHGLWEKDYLSNLYQVSSTDSKIPPIVTTPIIDGKTEPSIPTISTSSDQSDKSDCNPLDSATITSSDKIPRSHPLDSEALSHCSTPCKSRQPPDRSCNLSTPVPKHFPDLKKCISGQLTRGQLASLSLPPVSQIAAADIKLVIDPELLSNPLTLPVRPCEATLDECLKKLDGVADEDEDFGVEIATLGTSNACSIGIWKRACLAAALKKKLQFEIKWIDENSHLPSEANKSIKNILLDSKPSERILGESQTFIDVDDYASLVGERWLTGFIIDVVCRQLAMNVCNPKVLYLPTMVQAWAGTSNLVFLNTKFEPFLEKCSQHTRFVLTPIHVNGNHWGLLCLDVELKMVLYDDGYLLLKTQNQ